MTHPKKVFEYKGKFKDNLTEEDCDRYRAEIELPNDGTPDTRLILIIDVEIFDAPGGNYISLAVESKPSNKITKLGWMEVGNVDALANLLYGSARIETIKRVVPI